MSLGANFYIGSVCGDESGSCGFGSSFLSLVHGLSFIASTDEARGRMGRCAPCGNHAPSFSSSSLPFWPSRAQMNRKRPEKGPEQPVNMHRNVVEGEIARPVEAEVKGEVVATAGSGEEGWMLLQVGSFRVLGQAENPINIPNGTEVSIRYRNGADGELFEAGKFLSIRLRVMKSRDGPVPLAMEWRGT